MWPDQRQPPAIPSTTESSVTQTVSNEGSNTMEIGTPQVASRRRSVVGNATDEQIAELVDAPCSDDATPATAPAENEDASEVAR
jgi:hypothetical protein